MREVREEIGDFKVMEIIDLGYLYQNSTYFIKPIGVILVRLEINKKTEINKYQKSEDIERVEFYTHNTVKKMIHPSKNSSIVMNLYSIFLIKLSY